VVHAGSANQLEATQEPKGNYHSSHVEIATARLKARHLRELTLVLDDLVLCHGGFARRKLTLGLVAQRHQTNFPIWQEIEVWLKWMPWGGNKAYLAYSTCVCTG
jgi:hypothetical protein